MLSRRPLAGFVASLGLLAAAAGCAGGGASRTPATAAGSTLRTARPSLVVVIVIDQFRADYLDRFGAQLTGGFRRLQSEGTVFTDAHQDHAIPETAPGHAAILSGRFPRSTRIIANVTGVQDTLAIIGAKGYGASPHRFVGTTLVDWVTARERTARVLSVSRKDAGAILTVGRSKQHVYWYDPSGRFTTSSWYRDTLPEWVRRFNARGEPARNVGRTWTPLLPESEYPEPDSVDVESVGVSYMFPHVLPDDTAQALAWLVGWPWMDDLTISFALHGLEALALGRGGAPEMLVVSLSTTDAIGHRFGPDSREVHDQVLRLDRLLGRFLDSLFVLRDPATVAIALTADHGVGSLPELMARGKVPGAHRVSLEGPLSVAKQRMREAGVDSTAILFDMGILLLRRAAFASAKLSADELVSRVAEDMRDFPGVLRVDAARDLERAPASDYVARRWNHMLPRGSPAELVVTLEPHHAWLTLPNARHDSPHDYDTHVPLILHGPWFTPGRHERFVRVVDLAPTLARVLGVRPSEPIDGVVLDEALARP